MREKKFKNVTMNHLVANLAAIIPVTILLPAIFAFTRLYGEVSVETVNPFLLSLAAILVLPAGFIHELIHEAGWLISGKKHSDFIIGVKLPLCMWIQFKGTMFGWQLAIGTVLPFVALTIIPTIIALVFGNVYILMFAFTHALGCGADLLMSIRCLRYLKHTCSDTDGEIGFRVLV